LENVTATWLEISLIVEAELAEPVADVLARYIPSGIVIESTSVTPGPDGAEGQAVGPLHVCGYLAIDERVEDNRRLIEEALWYLGRIQEIPPAQFRIIQETDWSAAWKIHYKPIAIGKRLMIVPAWYEPPPGDRIPIRIDPGMAFGTGTHPSTQMCLEMLEDILLPTDENDKNATPGVNSKGIDLIDIGCGSGILSIAGLKLGARSALGVDIDANAVRAAHQNAILNDISLRLELGLGSLTEILAGSFPLKQAGIVIANIVAPVIVNLLDQGMGDLLIYGGQLVLAGIIDQQEDEIDSALRRNNYLIKSRRTVDDWVALRAIISTARQ